MVRALKTFSQYLIGILNFGLGQLSEWEQRNGAESKTCLWWGGYYGAETLNRASERETNASADEL